MSNSFDVMIIMLAAILMMAACVAFGLLIAECLDRRLVAKYLVRFFARMRTRR